MATTHDLQVLQLATNLPDLPITPTQAHNMDIDIVPQNFISAARGDPLHLRYSQERDRLRAEVAILRGSLTEESLRAEASNAEL